MLRQQLAWHAHNSALFRSPMFW